MTPAELVYFEARLIDEKRFDEWYDLFTEDCLYWMPLTRDQTVQEPTQTSLFYEDRLLLRVRIDRLRHPNAFSQQQPSFCQHVLQQPAVDAEGPESGRCLVRTPFLYVESQLDEQSVFAGTAFHQLVSRDGAWKIQTKRIELLNRDAALPSIQLLI
jgi:3-phenylpropionate/cinnamic acid dioxygenase small subunit